MQSLPDYPLDYRAREVQEITRAVSSGECVSILGLSGSGKSNLTSFLARRAVLPANCPHFRVVDCNRLPEGTSQSFFGLLRRTLQSGDADTQTLSSEMALLESLIDSALQEEPGVCLLLDRFDALYGAPFFDIIAGNLRALRDAFKYRLTYVTAARRPLAAQSELAELFFNHTLWLGPLALQDAMWSARRDAQRFAAASSREWSEAVLNQLVEATWGYPSFLRAACEAYAAGAEASLESLRLHPAVERRLEEFWTDQPTAEAIHRSGLDGHPLLAGGSWKAGAAQAIDTSQLTAKEALLLAYLRAHREEVCEKDDLVRAVWPEDVIFEQGVRDDSLAQLVRRLRVKVEPDPAAPSYIHTVPGRGYLYKGSA